MPIRDLPRNPNIEHLRHQARTLQRRVRENLTGAWEAVREFHPRPDTFADPAAFRLADAQLVTARQYGFASWPRLHRHVEVVTAYARSPHQASPGDAGDLVGRFLRLACLVYGGDRPTRQQQARQLLADHPELATASIHTMAAVGEVAAATALLAEDPSQARAEGGPFRWQPLLYAAYSRLDSPDPEHATLAVARLLLAHGADPNAGYLWEGVYPFTALTGAFGGGEQGDGNLPPHRHATELARLLLAAGADPNDLQTLYNRGLGGGGRDIGHIRLLLAYGLGRGDGGPWRARGGPGFPTPAQLLQDELLRAARDGLPELARLLVEHGVDVNGRGCHPVFGGHTAYELATLNGNREVAELLATAGAAVTTLDPLREFVAACLAADRAAVDRLLAADPGLTAEAIRREPYLVVRAAERGRTEAVRLLAALGFDVDAIGHTAGALHHAAWNGDLATVEALVELGADPNLRDREHGATPLGWAEYNHRHEVAAFLAGR